MGTTGSYLQPSHISTRTTLQSTIVMRFLAIVLVVALVGGAQAWSLGNIKENENKLVRNQRAVAEDKVEDLAEDIEDEEDELEDDDDDDEDELEDDDDEDEDDLEDDDDDEDEDDLEDDDDEDDDEDLEDDDEDDDDDEDEE